MPPDRFAQARRLHRAQRQLDTSFHNQSSALHFTDLDLTPEPCGKQMQKIAPTMRLRSGRVLRHDADTLSTALPATEVCAICLDPLDDIRDCHIPYNCRLVGIFNSATHDRATPHVFCRDCPIWHRCPTCDADQV